MFDRRGLKDDPLVYEILQNGCMMVRLPVEVQFLGCCGERNFLRPPREDGTVWKVLLMM